MFISDLATEIAWCLESGRPDLIPTLTDDQEALAQATELVQKRQAHRDLLTAYEARMKVPAAAVIS